ncbi:MAG: polysaccharide biosynthesis tyrosine autokinase [Acidimicrobiales bacterium]
MQATHDSTEVSLAQYTDVLKRRWLWIVLTPAVLVGLSLFNSLRADPVYRASVELLLQSKPSENVLVPSAAVSDPERALQNELRVIKGRAVQEAVKEAYGKTITASAVAGGDDDIIILSVSAADPKLAAERANVYATTYQTARVDAQLEDLANAQKLLDQQIQEFEAQIQEIDAPLVLLDAQINATPQTDPQYEQLLANRQREKERTDAARTEAQNQLNDYRQRLQVLQLSERLVTTGGVQILNPATVPTTPVSPKPVRDATQALIVGLFLGVALAFTRDQFDDSIRTKASLERAVRDLPTLALIPDDSRRDSKARDSLVVAAAPMSANAEAYRGLRTSLQYAALDREIKLVQVTSSSAGEGKTTTLSNLAYAFAQAGRRVVVVGSDLRKPRIHRTMQVDGAIGLTSVVLGQLTLREAIQTSPLHPNIDVLASGPLPPNPSELLSHERTARILESLAETYSMVFIDCPPVLPVTDALVLSRIVDTTIFIVMANRTTRRTARRAIEMLRQVESPLLGTVLNGVPAEETYGSFYEYYGYQTRSTIPIVGRFIGKKHYTMPSVPTEQLPDDDEDDEHPAEAVPTT